MYFLPSQRKRSAREKSLNLTFQCVGYIYLSTNIRIVTIIKSSFIDEKTNNLP